MIKLIHIYAFFIVSGLISCKPANNSSLNDVTALTANSTLQAKVSGESQTIGFLINKKIIQNIEKLTLSAAVSGPGPGDPKLKIRQVGSDVEIVLIKNTSANAFELPRFSLEFTTDQGTCKTVSPTNDFIKDEETVGIYCETVASEESEDLGTAPLPEAGSFSTNLMSSYSGFPTVTQDTNPPIDTDAYCSNLSSIVTQEYQKGYETHCR